MICRYYLIPKVLRSLPLIKPALQQKEDIMLNFARLLEVAEAAARAGAAELLLWRDKFTAREKSARDLVTDADLASQRAIAAIIRERFPDHGFLGEESPDREQLKQTYCWIVDPLDGTTNYVHGFPFYAVSVAVVHEGQLAAGVVFDPTTNECFTASRGGGARLNTLPISVSKVITLDRALVAVSFPPHPSLNDPDIQAFMRVSPECQAVRRTGSAAINLAYVACGRLDAHWAHSIHSWDSAAGVLLIEEAGGVVASFAGNPYDVVSGDYFVTSTRELFDRITPLLKAE
jgi:myo-inositol-1(or 4)-monophosphatase